MKCELFTCFLFRWTLRWHYYFINMGRILALCAKNYCTIICLSSLPISIYHRGLWHNFCPLQPKKKIHFLNRYQLKTSLSPKPENALIMSRRVLSLIETIFQPDNFPIFGWQAVIFASSPTVRFPYARVHNHHAPKRWSLPRKKIVAISVFHLHYPTHHGHFIHTSASLFNHQIYTRKWWTILSGRSL